MCHCPIGLSARQVTAQAEASLTSAGLGNRPPITLIRNAVAALMDDCLTEKTPIVLIRVYLCLFVVELPLPAYFPSGVFFAPADIGR